MALLSDSHAASHRQNNCVVLKKNPKDLKLINMTEERAKTTIEKFYEHQKLDPETREADATRKNKLLFEN